MNAKKIGVVAVLGSSMMWALEPLAAKAAYRGADFLEMSAVRAIVVMAAAWGYAMLTNRGDLRVRKGQIPRLAYIGLAGTVIADTLYFFALTKVPVINAVLIAHMQPIFIVLFGFVVLHEGLTRCDYCGIGIMVISGLLVTTRTWDNMVQIRLGSAGDLYVLAATVLWATTAITMRKYLREVHSGVITFYRYLIASAVFTIYLVWSDGALRVNVYQVAVGVISATGTILYYEAMKRVKAAQVAALELSTPLFAAVLVLFVPAETVTGMQIVGIVLLLWGVGLLSRAETKPAITFIAD